MQPQEYMFLSVYSQNELMKKICELGEQGWIFCGPDGFGSYVLRRPTLKGV